MLPLARAYPNNSCLFYSLSSIKHSCVSFVLGESLLYCRIFRENRVSGYNISACISAPEKTFREPLVNMHRSTKRVPSLLLSLSRIILDLGPLDDSLGRSVKSKYVAVCNWQRMQPHRANWRRRQIRQPPTTPAPATKAKLPEAVCAQRAAFSRRSIDSSAAGILTYADSLETQAGIRDGRTSATATATQIKERPNKAAREIKRSMASLHRRALISPVVCIPRSTSSCLCDRGQWNTFARTREIKKINLIPKLDRDG